LPIPSHPIPSKASCSICLDFFQDPVLIPECGHNYCRGCLTRSWGTSESEASSCPQCRQIFRGADANQNQTGAEGSQQLKDPKPYTNTNFMPLRLRKLITHRFLHRLTFYLFIYCS
uniref:RING-type domain-containing protein n=1 Tax=Naja naja TaxID=35670 RepID=A0A8C6VFA2_NAJNA